MPMTVVTSPVSPTGTDAARDDAVLRESRVLIASLFLPYNLCGGFAEKLSKLNTKRDPPAERTESMAATAPPSRYHFRFESVDTGRMPFSPVVKSTSPFASGRKRSDGSGRKKSPVRREPSAAQSRKVGSLALEPSGTGNVGLQKAVDSMKSRLKQCQWIGQLEISTENMSPEDKVKACELLATADCIPVFVNDAEFQGHYSHYCKEILWPTLHYILPEYSKKILDEHSAWAHYQAVNEKFADILVAEYREHDTIWIHDYHLFLVPKMVREKLPNAKIGFFLHIPFPSSELFRCLHVRKQLLEGLMGADLIGFQTQSFARHFLQTCSRILGHEITARGVSLENTCASVGTFPIGIDTDALNAKRALPEVSEMIAMLREKYAGRKVIVGRDKLDPVKGVRQKLLAFELFLTTYPEWQGKVVLVQVSLSTAEHADLQAQVSETVSRINSKFGTIEYTPVVYLHQDISFSHYLALLTIADACLITSLRDGMNLTSHEYIVCQETKKSPLIISEFTGTHGLFKDAICINPWDYKQVSDGINKALVMSEADRKRTHAELLSHVTSNTGAFWASSYLSELAKLSSDMARRFSVRIPHFSVTRFLPVYERSKKRIFFMNYDGTLVAYGKVPEAVTSSAWMSSVLASITADPNNLVFVMSGRTKSSLEARMCGVPNVGLCAENGCFVKFPGTNEWIDMATETDDSWHVKVNEIFEYYTERTPGSFIEQKEKSVVWHYRMADVHFGDWQAKECQNHITDAFETVYPIHAIMGRKNIEVRPRGASKMQVVEKVLAKYTDADLVFYIGDDRSDEESFQLICGLRGDFPADTDKVYLTCTMGNKSSMADCFVVGVAEVLNILSKLNGSAAPQP